MRPAVRAAGGFLVPVRLPPALAVEARPLPEVADAGAVLLGLYRPRVGRAARPPRVAAWRAAASGSLAAMDSF